MLKRLTSWLYFRRIARDLHSLVDSVDRQNDLLARLVEHFAPAPPVPMDRATLSAATGVSHLDPTEAYLAASYVARTQHDTGHVPDDEEILIYLADEKTRDLAQRLTQREAEFERLAESRR